jgi:hypothetical protein
MSKILFDDIFKIEDGIAVPKSPKELVIPELQAIIKRSIPMNGDSDNRKKLYAGKELLAVYLMADNRSMPRKRGLKGQALIDAVIEISGLPKGWKPDILINKCIKFYKETIESEEPSIRILGSINDSLTIANDSIEIMIDNLSQILTSITGDTPEAVVTKAENINSAISSIIKLSQNVSTEIERVIKIKEKISKYEAKIELGRGNLVITDSMIPNK